MYTKGGLRRHDCCSQLLAICIVGRREESYTIVCNRMQSGGILPNRMQLRGTGDNNF